MDSIEQATISLRKYLALNEDAHYILSCYVDSENKSGAVVFTYQENLVEEV